MRCLLALVVLLSLPAFAGKSLKPAKLTPPSGAQSAPPTRAEQEALLTAPHAIDRLRAFVVDESCFTSEVLKRKPGWPSGLGVESFGTENAKQTALTLEGPKPAPFAEFSGFVAGLVKGKRRAGYGLSMLGEKVFGYRAECLVTPPVLEVGEIGHVINKKHPELEAQSYRIAFGLPALDKLRKLPAASLRIAIVYDEVLVLRNVSLEELREQTETAVVELMSFAAPKAAAEAGAPPPIAPPSP